MAGRGSRAVSGSRRDRRQTRPGRFAAFSQRATATAGGRAVLARRVRRAAAHEYLYSYASTSPGCAYSMGNNTNRTSLTVDGGAPVTYCYDRADRLTSVTRRRSIY